MTALIVLRMWWIQVLTTIDRLWNPEEHRGAHHGETIEEDRARHEEGGPWWI